MDNLNKHIINKVFIEVKTDSKEKAYYFKDNIDMFIKEHVLPRLMTSFDDLGDENPDHFMQLERLDIELSIKPKQDLKGLDENIVNQILKKIKKLKEENPYKTNKEDALKLVKSDERQFEKLLHFLDNGTNSWFNGSEKLLNFNENISIFQDKKMIQKLIAVLENPLSRKRLILQFTDEEIQKIFNHFITNNQSEKETSLRPEMMAKEVILKGNIGGKKFTLKERFLIWDIVFDVLIEVVDMSKISNKFTQLVLETTRWEIGKNRRYIKTYFFELLKVTPALTIIQNLPKEIKKISQVLDSYQDNIAQSSEKHMDQETSIVFKNTQKGNEDKLDATYFNLMKSEEMDYNTDDSLDIPEDFEDVYVNHAGLVLVHPFLSQFFKNCGVINEQNGFLDKEKAVHILHYLATGKEQQLENNMVFEKFLCNLPSKYPINRFVPLENKVKNHVDEMLTSLIEHWEVMKNSSKDLLRNEFLKRPGKLILTEDRPRLILERKTQDILLDKIPWNISMIKLPWKNKIIFVDW
ncbi:contractile injection system tape measure protein [Aquimarina macrocephali]|uniref:contractile injection system tape measure protein n=1 Tax=Aquimarina macrocephali TaxID=666563 RepID=UPI000464D90B|nr:contractile injection system tape measure protein [Aquimarina macrocephali]